MTQKVYGLVVDHGDGSAGMRWFRNKDTVDAILENDGDEAYYGNEGVPNQILTFPDNLDLSTVGFRFQDTTEVESASEIALYESGAGIKWNGKGSIPGWLQQMLNEGETLLDYLNPVHPDYEEEKKKILSKDA